MPLHRVLYRVRALEPGMVEICGSFVCNSTSNPTTVVGKGVTSVTYSATGKWVINLDGVGTHTIRGAHFTLLKSGGSDQILQLDAVGAKSVTVGAWDVSGAAFAALDNTHTIYFRIFLKNSTAA